MASNRKNIEKERMTVAYSEAEKVNKKNDAKEFESYVNKIPAFIHTNGVGNTFAYLAGQKKTWLKVVDAIYNWLGNENSGFKSQIDTVSENKNAIKLLSFAKELSDSEYRALTIELLAYFNWLRKFAKANKINEDEKA